ncbi:MAG: ubiquinol-cytochrome C reductase, partial [Actinobacteria bacterium]|nr:ubiquinol-cytochrome C reductase [Actinomycetota bacterium]
MTEISKSSGPGGDEQAPAKLGYSPVADIPHRPRVADTDPKAARRAERQVSSMFLLSMLFVVLFIIAFVAI